MSNLRIIDIVYEIPSQYQNKREKPSINLLKVGNKNRRKEVSQKYDQVRGPENSMLCAMNESFISIQQNNALMRVLQNSSLMKPQFGDCYL